jgi:uncharacterized protein YkwD
MILSWQRLILFTSIVFLIVFCPAATATSQVFSNQKPEKEQALVPVTGADNFTGCAGDPIPTVNDAYEQRVVELTNKVRAEQGLPPLKRVEGLNESARYHAADMNVDDYFSHDTHDRVSDGLKEVCTTWDRIEHFYTNWLALAENIAAGQRSPEMAMDGWMNSPDHYHNIMSEYYWEIGSGYFSGDSTYRYYWVQNFGKKDGRYPLIIAGEAEFTVERNVEVYIYGDWQEMRLSLNNGEWTAWQPFLTRFTWSLPPVPGDYTLTAELRGPHGTTISSDTITLSEPEDALSGLFQNLWLGH